MLDRLMKFQDSRLFCSQRFHGTLQSANATVRAHALLINFCPYSPQTIDNKGGITSPFEQLNRFKYRENWLENLLVATSLTGRRPFLK
ncbi:MAG: hypothetical protein GY705_06625 [Bacteroidetes bacterium]|nr:hypothetical protein [Bacteroidota bacterium]